VCTTDSKHSLPVAANLLDQNFVADQPNQVWLSQQFPCGSSIG
jgi:transposase InsO family protein